jgi:transcriptional regulator with GAF, ATPase, and Fis domain
MNRLGRKNFFDQVEAYERKLICEALAQTQGNQAQAAKRLGLSPTTLASQIRRLGINPRSFREAKATVSYETFEKLCLWRSDRP